MPQPMMPARSRWEAPKAEGAASAATAKDLRVMRHTHRLNRRPGMGVRELKTLEMDGDELTSCGRLRTLKRDILPLRRCSSAVERGSHKSLGRSSIPAPAPVLIDLLISDDSQIDAMEVVL